MTREGLSVAPEGLSVAPEGSSVVPEGPSVAPEALFFRCFLVLYPPGRLVKVIGMLYYCFSAIE